MLNILLTATQVALSDVRWFFAAVFFYGMLAVLFSVLFGIGMIPILFIIAPALKTNPSPADKI